MHRTPLWPLEALGSPLAWGDRRSRRRGAVGEGRGEERPAPPQHRPRSWLCPGLPGLASSQPPTHCWKNQLILSPTRAGACAVSAGRPAATCFALGLLDFSKIITTSPKQKKKLSPGGEVLIQKLRASCRSRPDLPSPNQEPDPHQSSPAPAPEARIPWSQQN